MMDHPLQTEMFILVKSLFWLHDPKYLGFHLTGHAMNKILKDIINRYKMLQGHKV